MLITGVKVTGDRQRVRPR